MVDNVTAPAEGAKFATDQIGDTHYPRSKTGFGADGSYVDVSSTNPLPVAIVSGGAGGSGGGGDASAANQTTQTERLTAILGSVDGLEALIGTLNTLVGGTLTVALPTGAATSGKQDEVKAAVNALVPYLDGVEGLLTAVGNAIAGAAYYPAVQPVSAAALPLPNGAATQATLASLLTQITALLAVGTETYKLADNVTIAAGAPGPTAVTVLRGGYVFFDAAFSGSSPSLKLQRLGSDGTTWLDVVTRTASGGGDPIAIPNGSTLRVYNASAGSLTNVSAVLG